MSSVNLIGQTIKELEQRKQKTLKDIEFSTKLLSQTEQQKIETISQLSILKNQINLRKSLIKDLEKQIEIIELEIENKSLLVGGLHKDLSNLKKEYAKLIRFAHRNKTDMQILVFIFASNDFNQAYRRLRFYQQFIRFREKQGREIVMTKKMIEEEVNHLENSKRNLSNITRAKEGELFSLGKEENRFTKSVAQLQIKEKELRKEIEDTKRSMAALNKAIADLIEEEAKKAAATKSSNLRDARYLKLSEGFAGNKGKLPWPTNQGVIISDFGEHDHPVLKGVKVRNNGIDISTNPNEIVKSIFDGEVKKIVSIPGQNIAVIIRHGDFLSVYSNLVKVSVKIGDNVKALQNIGEVFNDPKTGKGVFNLQIWQENKMQNPKSWILP
jgi:septal ring factor EnvC (AmiA/AmiB activator)